MPTPLYTAELHAHSAYSYLDGTSTPAELAAAAATYGYEAMALTDHDGVAGSVEFAHACAAAGIRAIHGAEVTVALDAGGEGAPTLAHLTLLVESRLGWRNLCRLLTAAHAHTRESTSRSAEQPWVTPEQIEAHAEGLVCLTGCARRGVLAGAWERGEGARGERVARRFLAAFGRDGLRVELQIPWRRHDRARNRWLAGLADRLGVLTIATGDVHSHTRARARLQDAFVAVGSGQSLDEIEGRLRGNLSSLLASPPAMARRFAEHSEAVGEAVDLADRLRFDLTTDLGYTYPGEEDPDAPRRLAGLAWAALADRYGHSARDRAKAESVLREELQLVDSLGLAGFFILHHEILELIGEVAAKVRGPSSVRAMQPAARGRGSSVNSVLCHLLGLSHVDPIACSLYPGRFLSAGATSMPDIDIDLAHDIREAVIPAVIERRGPEHAALVAAISTYRPRGAVRDLGGALGLPAAEIDRVARALGSHGGDDLERVVAGAVGTERAASPRWRSLVELCGEAVRLPRHASQHPGGMVVATRPLTDICAVMPTRMADRQILQWDKDSCAEVGMLKIDLLGLRYLGVVEATVAEVERISGERIDLGRIPRDDPRVWERLEQGDTIGTSHTGSRAQQQMLRQTRPAGMADLAVQVAIVRPGPIQAGSVHPYVENRRLLREDPGYRIPYPHPCLEPILARTLGAVVYQDQVLQIATVYAGFTAAEAEGLRRAMSKRRSAEEIALHQARFFAGADRLRRPPATTKRLWGMVAGYSGYGFPEGHAWCLAALAYETNYLRIHHPAEYLAASLNEQPVGFSPPSVLVRDAARHGVAVRPPEVNRSEVDCHVDDEGAVRIGLAYVKGVVAEEIGELVAERERSGLYAGVADLASRSGAGRPVLERLAWAGALDGLAVQVGSLAGDRRRAAWAAGVAGVARRQGGVSQLPLALDLPGTPELEPPDDWERVAGNYRATGINLEEHPLTLLRAELGERVLRSSQLASVADGVTVEVAGMVIARQRPETARGMTFIAIEDEDGTCDLIVGIALYECRRAVIRGAPLVRARGRLERRGTTINVVVDDITALRSREPQGARSPDGDELTSRRRARERAVAELRASLPAGHAFGRRGG